MIARLTLVAVLFAGPGHLPAFAEDDDEPQYEMTTFQLVFVVDNPAFEEEIGVSESMAALRRTRMKTVSDLYLRNLIKADVALIAGELPDSAPIRQAAVLEVETGSDAERVFQQSEPIETGRRKLEIYTWWAAKDILQKPKDVGKTTTAYLGLLKRPVDAPSFSDEELERMQAGHLENIGKMADSGELVIAGPIENGADLRGILIFCTDDEERIRELVARDPAIQARRLELELHRWIVPQQAFPER